MADVWSQVKSVIPSVSGSDIFGFGAWFMGILFFAGVIGCVLYFYSQKKNFNLKIKIYRKINGVVQQVASDIGCLDKIGKYKDEVLLVKKHHKWLPRPKFRTGINTYTYFIREEDGEWVNVCIEDIDLEMNKLKMKFDTSDNKYARSSLHKLIDQNYKSNADKFKELLPYIGFGFLIFMLVLGFWFLLGKGLELATSLNTNIEAMGQIMTKTEEVLGALQNVCSNSGIRSV